MLAVVAALGGLLGSTAVVPCPPNFDAHGLPCATVTFAGAVAKPTTDVASEHQLWKEGMEMYANWTNAHGGLRLSDGVAYLNVSIENPSGDAHDDYISLYTGLLRNPKVHVLLAPIRTDAAVWVLKELNRTVHDDQISPKPVLVTSSVPAMFTHHYPYVWAVDSPTSRVTAARAIVDMLAAHNRARTFTFVGETTPFGMYTLDNMSDEVKQLAGANTKLQKLADSKPEDPFAIQQAYQEAKEENPDAFVAIGGHTNGFTAVLGFFKVNRYVPPAAVYVGGLATTETMRKLQQMDNELCSEGTRTHCLVFDQWIGTVTWTADMNYPGPEQWLNCIPAPYHNRMVSDVDGHNRSRYIGSTTDFRAVASRYLGDEPTQYHASAAATLLLFQLAVELYNNGTGLATSQLSDGKAVSDAMIALDARSTFFGPMKLQAHWNEAFRFGIGQFQQFDRSPRLIGPPDMKPTAQLIYPAEWPCYLLMLSTERSDSRRYASRSDGSRCQPWSQQYNRWEYWVGVGAGICAFIMVCLFRKCGYKCCAQQEKKPLLRSSLLGSEKLPGSVLGKKDVSARWATAQMAAEDPEVRRSFSSSVTDSFNRTTTAPQVAGARYNKVLGYSRLAPVFFSDINVRELQPEQKGGDPGWQSRSRSIGTGAYGSVFKATWRGNEVAVKVLRLPEEPASAGDDAKIALCAKLEEIVTDFTKEVEICCDLAHPNLVTMLGYATQPELLLMQELMDGKSVDQQLYNEKWRPTTAQILKVALDVASGMKYLHTAFQEERNAKRPTRSGKLHAIDKPIIHRDLKSPNLLLLYPPPPRGQEGDAKDLVCKISDFGLSRDKRIEDGSMAATALMTGCGSILWMAPEIMLGEKYNEKVDVYSYAMCLVELVHRNLPWHGSGVGQQAIPVKVTKGLRPNTQIKRCQPPGLKQLIEECWAQQPHSRPEFPVILHQIEQMYVSEITETRATTISGRGRGSRTSRAASPSIIFNDRIDEGEEYPR